jgi:hypothetical protein
MSHAASSADQPSGGRRSGDGEEKGRVRKAGLFDIRTFIGALLGFDGVVILLVGLFGDNSTTTESSPPVDINLIAGIGLIIAALFFFTWQRLRPVKVLEPPPGSDEAPRAAH